MGSFSTININTKVRRIGYILQIIKEIGKSSLSEETILARLTAWSENNLKSLNKHIDSKGVIQRSFKNTSARRYLSAALGMELVARVGGEYRLTKYGKILLSFSNRDVRSPFLLSLSQTCFLTNRLFLLDSDYLLILLQLIKEYGECPLSLLQGKFRDCLLLWLDVKSKYVFSKEPEKRKEVSRIINRIKSWRKPKKYIEHIIPPRVNWLLDLKLLDWGIYKATHKFTLSDEGKKFLSILPKIPGAGTYRWVDYSWLENEYFKSFIETFMPHSEIIHFSQVNDERRREILFRYLEESLNEFRTTELMRIAASQFLYYTCIKLAIFDKIACGFDDLKQLLKEISKGLRSKYYFYWSLQENDGYIIKR